MLRFQGLGLSSRVPQRDGARGWKPKPQWGHGCWQRCHSEQSSGCEFLLFSPLVSYLLQMLPNGKTYLDARGKGSQETWFPGTESRSGKGGGVDMYHPSPHPHLPL